MRDFYREHRVLVWSGGAVLALLLVVVIALSLFDWNLLRPYIARAITVKTGRPAAINGDLKVHIWSWNPTAEVNGLAIKNPPWADRELMFGADRITISVSLGRLLRGQIVLPQVDLQRPVVNLERDSKARASWELGTTSGKPNHNAQPAKLPTVQRLAIDGGKLHVVDQIRKLSFSGSFSAAEKAGSDDPSAFKVRSNGSLNAKPFRLDANGGPLLNLEPDKPYSFSAHLSASDIDLETHVTVPKPFDLSNLTVKFVATGNDLADVFYLTGLALPNTPRYRLAATVQVDGTKYTLDDLSGKLGTSDIEGKLQVESAGARPKLTAQLASHRLDAVDLRPAVGHPAPPSATPSTDQPSFTTRKGKGAQPKLAPPPVPVDDGRLLPDADLQVDRVRGMDADVTFKAASFTAPKLPMKQVAFHLVLDNGLLTIDPLSFELDAGRFTGKVRIDARGDVPRSDIDVHIQDVDLAQFKSATSPPPLQGTLAGRIQFHGSGSSVHKLAAASDGAVSVVIPHGEIAEIIPELTGINVLQGLGFLLKKGENKIDIRCGIIDFKDHNGSLNTTTLYVDTTNVLITGRGKINLDTEDIDLGLQGDPKQVRLLRLRSPITVHGTLLHPGVGINTGKLAEQGAIAAVLGTLLTPAAAALAFIDPGLAKDKDCSTVLAQADAGIAGTPPAPPPNAPPPPPEAK